MNPNDAVGMANSVDPDLGMHCLPRSICPKPLDNYGTSNIISNLKVDSAISMKSSDVSSVIFRLKISSST